ncbi:MAG TPA: DUF4956 domain-containing protein [Longimicrobium sp.]|nr:DUF4956 domain-containing protein [Longimicrobium sp.]
MSRSLALDPAPVPMAQPHRNGSSGDVPAEAKAPPRRFPRTVRRAPVLPLALYYGALVAVWAGLGWIFPGAVGRGAQADRLPSEMAALVAMTGALALMAPVVSVYMRTRRLRYDPSLVHSLIILPVVTAGIFLMIENSLARAFSLAGIMAAVRFRNTLPETRDIVYILLALGIGLAAGAEAMDVAVVMSAAFNVLVLFLWSFNVGSIYAAGSARRGILSVGETRLLLGTTPAARAELRKRMAREASGLRAHGVLLVHTPAAEVARNIVEEVLFESTHEWRRAGTLPNPRGVETLAYLVRLRKKQARPAELLGNLDECSVLVRAAEYLPLNRDPAEKHGGHHGHQGKHHHGHRDDGHAADEESGEGGAS